jgi:hypothetical protein
LENEDGDFKFLYYYFPVLFDYLICRINYRCSVISRKIGLVVEASGAPHSVKDQSWSTMSTPPIISVESRFSAAKKN